MLRRQAKLILTAILRVATTVVEYHYYVVATSVFKTTYIGSNALGIVLSTACIGSLRIGRVGAELGGLDAVLVDDLDDEIGLGDEEAGLQLLHAVLDDGDGLVLREALIPVAVHNGKAESGGVALTAVVDLLEGGHVVQEVEGAGLGAGVVSAEEDVDLIRAAAEGGGQLPAHEVGLGVRRELHAVVGQLVEGDVLLDVLAEVDEVGIRAGYAEGRMA